MTEIDSKTMFQGIGNDFKILIDDVIGTILTIHEDMELLKVKTSKPDKHAAALLLDYLTWADSEPKKNLEKLCGEEIKQCMKWLEYYCEKHGTTKEQALQEIINGEI
ncbi:MAG TPA: hypothetical protein DDW90_11595 [Cyanobacteria bacterium UBA9971]|nr:hypothetical protein [Cyanobacteria bacterium UBA9971]